MKAVQYDDYGGREKLYLADVPDPGDPGAGGLRVRVHASSVNPVDGKIRRGELKLLAGHRFPKRPGIDFSGVVEAVGAGVVSIAAGDAVYGSVAQMGHGAFAEHVVVHAASVAPKPASMPHALAAGVPVVGIAALQVLRDLVKVAAGDRILVNGCTGGVGLYALQIARQAGAVVTGVCGTEGVDLARRMGAHEVVDYRQGPLSPAAASLRAILELSGRLPFEQAEAWLADHGQYVDFSPSPAALVGSAIANPFRPHKHVFAMTAARTADLGWLADHLDRGLLQAPPTTVLPLERFAEAVALAEQGGRIGKVVVSVVPDGPAPA